MSVSKKTWAECGRGQFKYATRPLMGVVGGRDDWFECRLPWFLECDKQQKYS